jgi:hypothetical protein
VCCQRKSQMFHSQPRLPLVADARTLLMIPPWHAVLMRNAGRRSDGSRNSRARVVLFERAPAGIRAGVFTRFDRPEVI